MRRVYDQQEDFCTELENVIDDLDNKTRERIFRAGRLGNRYNGIESIRRKIRWCRTCGVFKPRYTHHCRICGQCVLDMDHHCPWMNNCVGWRNQKHFLLFLFWTTVGCVYSLILVCAKIYACIRSTTHNCPACYTTWTKVHDLGTNPFKNQGRHDFLGAGISILVAIFGSILSFFFLIFVIMMGCEQFDNIRAGFGTIDALKKKRGDGEREENDETKDELERPTFFSSLRRVMGEPLNWTWLIPFAPPEQAKGITNISLDIYVLESEKVGKKEAELLAGRQKNDYNLSSWDFDSQEKNGLRRRRKSNADNTEENENFDEEMIDGEENEWDHNDSDLNSDDSM
eukprot:g4316.t1